MEKEESKRKNYGGEKEECKEDETEGAPAQKKKGICKKILRNDFISF